jgi:tRNA nucleotidyltransferase (CCA-adding enzyme)
MTDFADLPNAQRRALDIVRDVAIEKECRPFLVGGPVRDLLLGRHSIDIDLTLEVDSSTLARALAKRINGRVKSFPQFLTYKVVAEGMPEIDIATARRERYRKPGALPTVQPGRLKDDLMRRDFSINAMAVDLMSGAEHDPANGRRDIANRLVRVLHERSFLDDPTRIFRAIRLAGRLGFALEPGTARLLAEAIDSGGLTTISRERIWRELFLAMDEADAPKVLAELVAHGALAVLFGKRPLDPQLLFRLEQMKEHIGANPALDRQVLYTGALLLGDASPVDLEGSGFSQKRARNVVQISNELPRFLDALVETNLETDAERRRMKLYRSASPEMLSVIAAADPDQGVRIVRFHEYEQFRLPLRGNDLEVVPGPHVAKALERAREAVFTGEIPAEEAREFARAMAIRYLDPESATDPK